MTDEETKTVPNTNAIIEAGLEWIEGNAKKNEGAREERYAKNKLSLLVKGESITIEIDPHLDLIIGVQTDETEEIDAKLLFDKNPDAFWSLVDIPKTAAIALLGEAAVAKISRPLTKITYKVKKQKK